MVKLGKKPSKGRQKIEIRFIEDKARRQVTLCKRKGGIFKKCSELQLLCGAHVAVAIFSKKEEEERPQPQGDGEPPAPAAGVRRTSRAGNVFALGTPSVDHVLRRLAPLPGGRGRWLVAGSIVKQLSSVVKWPRGAAAPHGGPKPPAQRRPRTAWIPAAPSGAEGYHDEEERYYDDEDQSDSAAARARVSGSRDASGDESDGVADWGLPNGRLPSAMGYSGVKAWLHGLGLSRYAPVFEIHEVDDGVLPMLTLEDLKDMGIGAVGSRRKMYAAIQKLRSDNVS